MAKKDEQNTAADAPVEEFVVPAPHPDAAAYVLQPTSEKLNIDVVGDVPPERFQEQVLKSDAKSGAVDSHPEENQPAPGVPAE